MQKAIMTNGGHQWEKQNLVTVTSAKGMYDKYKCAYCGITGKSYQLGVLEVEGNVSTESVLTCSNRNHKYDVPELIKITRCAALGKTFSNLLPDSEHRVVEPPKGERHSTKGVWVMGVGEPVLVLSNEFKIIK